MKEEHGYIDKQLRNKINEIALKDGKLDGKVQMGVIRCNNCGRVVLRGKSKCMYCETDLNIEVSAFQR